MILWRTTTGNEYPLLPFLILSAVFSKALELEWMACLANVEVMAGIPLLSPAGKTHSKLGLELRFWP